MFSMFFFCDGWYPEGMMVWQHAFICEFIHKGKEVATTSETIVSTRTKGFFRVFVRKDLKDLKDSRDSRD